MLDLKEFGVIWNKTKNIDNVNFLDKYLKALLPLFISVLPKILSGESIDYSLYISMAVSTLVPLITIDLGEYKSHTVVTRYKKIDLPRNITLMKIVDMTWTRKISFQENTDLSIKDEIVTPLFWSSEKKKCGLWGWNRRPAILTVPSLKLSCILTHDKDILSLYHTDIDILSQIIKFLDNADSYNGTSTYKSFIKDKNNNYIISSMGNNNYKYSNIILSDYQFEQIDNHITNFTSVSVNEKLKCLGFKNNLSMVLYGEPGTGKTGLSSAIAERLNRDLFIVDKTDPETFFNNINLIDMKSTVILFDDVDLWNLLDRRIILSTGEDCQNSLLIKMMELLNGNTYDFGCFIFTTNFINKINPALFRDGRINLKLEISGLNEITSYNKFFLNIYNDFNWVENFTKKELQQLLDKNILISKLSEIAKINLYNEQNFIAEIKKICIN